MYDLPFALRKLTVMKCQMKKWRMERLQLESENRSLKQALQSFGIDFIVEFTRSLPSSRYFLYEATRAVIPCCAGFLASSFLFWRALFGLYTMLPCEPTH